MITNDDAFWEAEPETGGATSQIYPSVQYLGQKAFGGRVDAALQVITQVHHKKLVKRLASIISKRSTLFVSYDDVFAVVDFVTDDGKRVVTICTPFESAQLLTSLRRGNSRDVVICG